MFGTDACDVKDRWVSPKDRIHEKAKSFDVFVVTPVQIDIWFCLLHWQQTPNPRRFFPSGNYRGGSGTYEKNYTSYSTRTFSKWSSRHTPYNKIDHALGWIREKIDSSIRKGPRYRERRAASPLWEFTQRHATDVWCRQAARAVGQSNVKWTSGKKGLTVRVALADRAAQVVVPQTLKLAPCITHTIR